MAESVDTVVIGAGVVGLAIARSLASAGHDVLILEREDAFGTVTSARNSEVIHAGIYYAKNSLKARLCVAGRHMLYDFCADRGVPHKRCGKLIVACSADELEQFDGIARRAWDNGVDDLRQINREEALDLEPELDCHGALLSPSTGIVDSHGFMLALLGEAEARDAMLVLNTEVASVDVQPGGFLIRTGGEHAMELNARKIINSAGLAAPGLARMTDGLPATTVPDQWIAKGNYFSLSSRAPFEHLIYPAPVTGGLGIHLTLDLNGRARFGPDVEWIQTEDYAVDPKRSKVFYDAIRRYWPGLPDASLMADYSGIRPKLTRQGDKHTADFRISGASDHNVPGYIGLYGIESPGLTSSLAIADHVRDMLAEDMA